MAPLTRPGLRSRTTRVLRVAMCAIALACSGRALAQGTSGAFADPLSVGELKALLERRGALPQGAWPAMQAAYERYSAQCTELREGEIESFQKRTRAAEAVRRSPSVTDMQSFMRDHAALTRRLEALDQELFVAVGQAVPDAQEAVDAARLQRQRDAMREGMGRMLQAGSSLADVERVAFELEMDDATRQRVGKALDGYGARQVAAMRELGERQQQLWLAWMKDVAEAEGGGSAAQSADVAPEPAEGSAAQQVGEAVPAGDAAEAPDPLADRGKAIWARLSPPIVRQRKALIESSRTAAKAVRAALSGEPALERRFWNAWRAASHTGVRGGEDTAVPAMARRALRIRSIDDAARQSIRQVLAEWWAADDAIAAEWGAAMDEFESEAGPFSFDSAGFQAYSARLMEYAKRQDERAAQAIAAIGAVIGEDKVALMKGEDRSRDDELLGPELPDMEVGAAAPASKDRPPEPHEYVALMQDRQREAWSQPMRPDDAARIAAAMRADESGRAIIESLAADHATAWRERIDPMFLAARPESMEALKDPKKSLAHWPELVAAAVVVRDELDARLFADIEAVAGEASRARALGLLRGLRSADSAARDSASLGGVMWGAQQGPARVDPLRGAVAPGMPAEEIEAALAAAEPLLPRLNAEAERLRAAARRSGELQAQVVRLQSAVDASGPPDTPEKLAAVEQLSQQVAQAFHAQSVAMASLRKAEDAMADAVLVAVPESRRAAVRAERLREAHPAYFGADPVQAVYERAGALPGLDAQTRESLVSSAAAYAKARDAAEAALMSALSVRPPHPTFGDPEVPGTHERWQKEYAEWMVAEEKVAKAAFARRVVREQALVSLGAILGKERAAAARVPDAGRLAREEERRMSGMAGPGDEADEGG